MRQLSICKNCGNVVESGNCPRCDCKESMEVSYDEYESLLAKKREKRMKIVNALLAAAVIISLLLAITGVV